MYTLAIYKTRSISGSANFLSGVFFLNGCYFVSQAVLLLPSALGENALHQALMQTSIYFEALITGLLWVFGLIFMFNQYLNVENRESRENLEIIINTSPDAISVIRLSNGCFVDVNEGFIAMGGYTRAEILGRSTVDINIWNDPADRFKFDKSLAETGSYQNQEIVFRRRDGTQIIGLVFAKVISLQGVPHIISVVHDINERKKTERELRKLTNVVEQNQSSVVITDTSGTIEYVNPKFCEVTGYGLEEVYGKTTRMLRSVTALPEIYQELWATISVGRKWQGRFQNRKKNGDLFWESAIISPIMDEHGVITNYVAVKEDITELILAEEALLKLAAVEERQRLARDLHDSVNQSIHGMVLFSETLVSTLDKNNLERARQIAERLQESARQALKETRLMLYQLQSSKVDGDLDLIRDLETRLLSVERHAGVRALILQDGSMEHCPHGWHENLFWITIEALNNALKHAQSRNIQIIVRCFPRHLDLEVHDDGKGFNPDKPHSGGLGLQNMRERAHLLGGELTILATPGKGSKVCFSAEIKEA
jgi:PAS domain S-box-containing protein